MSVSDLCLTILEPHCLCLNCLQVLSHFTFSRSGMDRVVPCFVWFSSTHWIAEFLRFELMRKRIASHGKVLVPTRLQNYLAFSLARGSDE